MNRPILVYAMMFVATAAMGAQEASQTSPYQGTSTPPPDDTIVTTSTPQAKPPAGRVYVPEPVQNQAEPQVQPQAHIEPQSQPAPTNSAANSSDPDGGIVTVQQSAPAPEQPALTRRNYAADPDGDIVHPQSLGPGEVGEGTTIRVKLLDRLSTASTEKGEAFRSQVVSDFYQGGQVLIPAGTEIDGRVAGVSSGHLGGSGSMRLRPTTMILPDGKRYRFDADITGTSGSKTKVRGEGTILPTSRLKRNSIEYGAAVGAGATTGAIVAGPVGALTGSLIGAGVITAHLLVSHPQATLEPGTVLVFTLSEPLQLTQAAPSGN